MGRSGQSQEQEKDKFLFAGIEIPQQHDNPNWTKAFLKWLKEAALPDIGTRLTLDMLLEQYHFLYRHFLKVSIEVRKLQRTSYYKTSQVTQKYSWHRSSYDSTIANRD